MDRKCCRHARPACFLCWGVVKVRQTSMSMIGGWVYVLAAHALPTRRQEAKGGNKGHTTRDKEYTDKEYTDKRIVPSSTIQFCAFVSPQAKPSHTRFECPLGPQTRRRRKPLEAA